MTKHKSKLEKNIEDKTGTSLVELIAGLAITIIMALGMSSFFHLFRMQQNQRKNYVASSDLALGAASQLYEIEMDEAVLLCQAMNSFDESRTNPCIVNNHLTTNELPDAPDLTNLRHKYAFGFLLADSSQLQLKNYCLDLHKCEFLNSISLLEMTITSYWENISTSSVFGRSFVIRKAGL